MDTHPTLRFLLVATVCVSSALAAPAQKKAGGGGNEHANKGVQLAQQGAFDQAIAEFTTAIQEAPKDARLYFDRARVYFAMKDFQHAADDYGKVVELTPQDFRGYAGRGAAESELGQNDPAMLDRAMADFNKALEMKPNEPQVLQDRGLVFYRQKNFQAAINDYTQAIQGNPNSVLAYRRRSDAYVGMKQYDKAVPDLEAALKLKPDDPQIAQNLQYVRGWAAAMNAPQPTAPPATPPPTPAPTPSALMQLLTPMNIGIAAGLIAVLFIILVLVKRNRPVE